MSVSGKVLSQGVINPRIVILGTRFRTDVDLDEEFLTAIKEKGVMQPITVDQDWKLVCGGRRVAAALELNLEEIPYVQRYVDGELDLRECELIENICRKDFKWQDRNNIVSKIHELNLEKHGGAWSQRATADMLNKSVGGINRHLALNKAMRHFPQLAECKTEDDAVKLFRRLGERIIVKDLAKQHTAGAIIGETAQSSSTEEKQVDIPVGIRNARYASSHYRVGDALAGLQELLDKELTPNIAIVEIDPPYAIDLPDQKKGELNRGIGEYNEIEQDNYIDFMWETLSLCHKVTPPNCRFIIWFGIEWYSMICDHLSTLGMDYDIIPGIWAKPTGQTASPDRYLARSYETFLVAWKGKGIPINKRGRSNVFSFNPEPHTEKYHPTQRPIGLMEELLLTFGWPGSIILCPFLGSGTTLRAGYRCGMTGFGWDLSEVYKEGFLASVEKDIQAGELNKVKMVDDE